MAMDKLYIVIQAYNEAENIEEVAEEWTDVIEKHAGNGQSRLVIIDDGSIDDTWQTLQKIKKENVLLTVIKKPNTGHGGTIRFGYEYALECGADYIFQTDSDRQTLPSEFENFWNAREQYDMVIGWRNKRQDGISRIFVTRMLRFFILCTFHVHVCDANTPYRLMKAEPLKECLTFIPENYNLTNVAVSAIMTKRKESIKFIPITFRKRQGGKNSIDIKKIMHIGIKALEDFRIINRNYKNAMEECKYGRGYGTERK